jgi:hypothetical protein
VFSLAPGGAIPTDSGDLVRHVDVGIVDVDTHGGDDRLGRPTVHRRFGFCRVAATLDQLVALAGGVSVPG